MQTQQTELSEVIYNAASQCFEATVTVHDGDNSRSYACEIDAPITMSFARAAEGLATQALRKHGGPRGLRAFFTRAATRTMRTTRPMLRRGLPVGQYGFFRGRAA